MPGTPRYWISTFHRNCNCNGFFAARTSPFSVDSHAPSVGLISLSIQVDQLPRGDLDRIFESPSAPYNPYEDSKYSFQRSSFICRCCTLIYLQEGTCIHGFMVKAIYGEGRSLERYSYSAPRNFSSIMVGLRFDGMRRG